MGRVSGCIRNGCMGEAVCLSHVMSLVVVMFGTAFPVFATSHFRLYAASTNMLAGIAREGMFYGRNL